MIKIAFGVRFDCAAAIKHENNEIKSVTISLIYINQHEDILHNY